jgi:UDP-N-acetyl-D-galactosamine dehydrogenase
VVHDPRVSAEEAQREYGVALHAPLPDGPFAAVVLAVPHAELVAAGAGAFRSRLETGGLLFDVRGALPRADVDDRL